jgi:two-component system OmpR family response regulator
MQPGCYDHGMRILVVEDEQRMAELLERTLQEEGHQTIVARDGREGFDIARAYEFDAIVLDVMLPGMDGITLARQLREHGSRAPVLMLTARDSTADIVSGLDSGADDYLTKPFSIEVFLARVRAISRRGPVSRPACMQVADLRLDPATHRVTRGGEPISLTPREYRLLELLMRSAGRVVSRGTILESVWGFESDVNENTLEAFVRLLRLKVDASEPKLIHTVRGFGYMMREP